MRGFADSLRGVDALRHGGRLFLVAIHSWLTDALATLFCPSRGLCPCPIGLGGVSLVSKGLGAGLATIALAGVGAGIGIVFGSLIHSV